MLIVDGLLEINLENKQQTTAKQQQKKNKNNRECFETLHDGKFQKYAEVKPDFPGFISQFEELCTQGQYWPIKLLSLTRLFWASSCFMEANVMILFLFFDPKYVNMHS